jgi:hypothetical protein
MEIVLLIFFLQCSFATLCAFFLIAPRLELVAATSAFPHFVGDSPFVELVPDR